MEAPRRAGNEGETSSHDPDVATYDPGEAADCANRIRANVERVLRGKDQVVRRAVETLVSAGHLLIEDVLHEEEQEERDDARDDRRGEPALGKAKIAVSRFRLRYRSTDLDLSLGAFLIGRSSRCNLAVHLLGVAFLTRNRWPD